MTLWRATRGQLVTLLVWGLALAACIGVIVHTKFTTDLSAFMPAAPDTRQRLLIDQLQAGTPARTLIVAIEGGSAAQRSAASVKWAQGLRESKLFDQVLNGDTAGFAALGEWVFARRYLLSPAVTPAHFQADGLREAFEDTLSLLGTPAGALVKPLLERDPTGETQRIAEASVPGDGPRSVDGAWVSRSGEQALLVLQTRAAGGDLDALEATMAVMRTQFQALGQPALTLQMSGAPTFAVQSRAKIESEVRYLAIVGTLLMGALLLLAFGSFLALGAAMLPVASGVVTGIAAVSLGMGSVHGVTLGFGTTLIGEAVDYAIYFLIQARGREGEPAGQGWRHWVRDGWPTVRLGLLTSVCGFLALVFSGFAGLAQLGLFSVAGLIGAALTTRFVLPVLMPDGTRGVGLRRALGGWALAGARRAPRWRHAFTALGVVSLVGLLWHNTSLWSTELSSLSPVPQSAIALDTRLRAELASSDATSFVVVRGSTEEATLQVAETVVARLEKLVDAGQLPGQLAGFDSVTRLVPSLATQAQRRAALPDAVTLLSAVETATQGGPLRAQRLAPFVAEVQAARALPAITLTGLQGSGAAPMVNALFMASSGGGYAALLPLRANAEAGQPNPRVNEARVQAALQDLPNVHTLNLGDELGSLYRHYLGEARTQASLGALGVVLLMALWLRSWPRLLAVCQPLLLAVLITLAGLVLLGVQLGILHLVGMLLVVAVGSNYALFFDLLQRSADPGEVTHKVTQNVGDGDTLASLLLANLTTVLSFGLLAFSEIPALSAIGRVVAPGAFLALVLSAAFVPARAPVKQQPSTPLGRADTV